MSRGMVANEPIVSQAATDEFRANHERVFGERTPGQRGRWVWDAQAGRLVRADEYVPPVMALEAPVIADRIHEGTVFHDGERVRDLGSRQKRREFLRETGLAEASDFSPAYREKAGRERERAVERRIDESTEAAARRLYNQRKWRD